MTREEAIVNLEKLIALFHTASEQSKMVDYSKIIETLEFAAAALRPVSREQVEKVWRGEWISYLDGEHIMPERYYSCSKCGDRGYTSKRNFCDSCGAPMTDEAVQILIERMEELKDGKGV